MIEWTRQKALEILRLPDDATELLIKKTYKKLFKIYHTDKCMQTDNYKNFMPEFGSPKTQEECTKIFIEIKNAYKFLTKNNKKKYEIEIPKDYFKCMIVDQPVEYCFFYYDKYDEKFSYRIPRTLLMKNNNLVVNNVNAISGENNCDNIWDALKWFLPQRNALQLYLLHDTTIWYQEKNTNKYFIFIKLKLTGQNQEEGLSFSADITEGNITDENNTCVPFANFIIKQKLSTGQKASIAALFATIAAVPVAAIGIAAYKNQQSKRLKVHE
jgi:hypothetical protein